MDFQGGAGELRCVQCMDNHDGGVRSFTKHCGKCFGTARRYIITVFADDNRCLCSHAGKRNPRTLGADSFAVGTFMGDSVSDYNRHPDSANCPYGGNLSALRFRTWISGLFHYGVFINLHNHDAERTQFHRCCRCDVVFYCIETKCGRSEND